VVPNVQAALDDPNETGTSRVAAHLIVAVENFDAASRRYSRRLLFATWFLVGLTIVLAGLTVVLITKQ
jgi:hypothetical protein